MTKSKKGIADKVRKAKQNKGKNVFKVQNNPFEVKINRQKHSILGRKTKHDRGLPGVSRSKANKKRKQTLLKEYKERYKTNNVTDERFGEETADMSVEEKMLQRFAMEKKKKHEKMSMFNLNDEEQLTHFGQSLSHIEDLDTNIASDEEDTGVISGEYVSEAHFGGGIFTKKSPATDDQAEGDKPKSRKEIIDEIISKSKRAKFEKQNAQDEANDLREKLDSTWQEVENLLKSTSRTPKDKEFARESYKLDEYDVAVKQMQYDRKAAPSARGKTEAEKAAEEATKIRKLEEERLERMNEGYNHSTKKSTHRSADDLNYDFFPEKVVIEPLQYRDGVMVTTEERIKQDNEDDWRLDRDVDRTCEDASKSEEDQEEEEQEEEDEHFSDNGQDDASESSEEEEDEFSDIVTDDEDFVGRFKPFCDKDNSVAFSPDKDGHGITNKNIDKFPSSYKEFCGSLETKYNWHCEKYVATLRKKFPPASAEGNKEKLIKLFEFIWQQIYSISMKKESTLKEINGLISHLYEVCLFNPIPCAKYVVRDMQRTHQKDLLRNGKIVIPDFGHLIQFKLIKILFSTSDFIHPVCAPAMVFMSHIVHSCRPMNLRDVAACLLLCTLMHEYVCFSKRFVPECLNFLCAVICLSLAKTVQRAKGIPDCASLYLNSRNCELLVLRGDSGDVGKEIQKPNLFELLVTRSPESLNTDEIRLQLLRTALRLVLKFALLYSQMPCFKEIFEPIQVACTRCLSGDENNLGESDSPLAEILNEVQAEIQRLIKRGQIFTPMVQSESNKPKPLPLYDPRIEEVCEPFQKGSRKKTTAIKRERDRLQHKYKRELKGAVREIKKDARFIAREKLNEQIEKDKERAAKVKRLFGFLSNQEGEVKMINRKKFKLDVS